VFSLIQNEKKKSGEFPRIFSSYFVDSYPLYNETLPWQ